MSDSGAARDRCSNSPPAGRPLRSALASRREHLLGVATTLFLTHGYNKVSLASIASEARVAVRTIYVQFGGKADLFCSVIAGRYTEVLAPFSELATDIRPLDQIVSDFALRYASFLYSEDRAIWQLMLLAIAGHQQALAARAYQAGPGQTERLLTRLFTERRREWETCQKVTPDVLATHLLLCLRSDQWPLSPLPPPDAAEVRIRIMRGLDLFLHTIQ